MNEAETMIIMRYIEEYLFEPGINWPKKEFDIRSYSRWVAYEILELIMDNPFISAESLIQGLIIKMIYLSCISDNNNNAFTIAVDTAEDILNLLGGDV